MVENGLVVEVGLVEEVEVEFLVEGGFALTMVGAGVAQTGDAV